ncbi:MAG: hypothetical protein AAF264_02410 [Pseudomonadota bacterium]
MIPEMDQDMEHSGKAMVAAHLAEDNASSTDAVEDQAVLIDLPDCTTDTPCL